MSMPLGLSIASHSGGCRLLPVGAGSAQAAELARFAAVFVSEGHGDALALCHPVAAATRQVRIGTAIANAALRPPVLAAKTAAQLDQASGGRFILGLGVANMVMNTRFRIAPFPPLTMIEEYAGVVRAVLGGSKDGYDGQVFRTGMVPLDSPPVRAGLPFYLAALGPRMLKLACRVADGVILNLMTPAQAGEAARAVRGAAQAAGRDPASVEVACVVHCCLADDDAVAAAARGRSYHATFCIPLRRGCSASLTAARACAACGSGCWPATAPARRTRCRSRRRTGSWRAAARTTASPGSLSTWRRAWTCRSCSRCRCREWGYEKTIAALGGACRGAPQ